MFIYENPDIQHVAQSETLCLTVRKAGYTQRKIKIYPIKKLHTPHEDSDSAL